MSGALAMAMALAIDAMVGWPERLYRVTSHPVVWVGWLIDIADRQLNRQGDRPAVQMVVGAMSTVFVVGVAVLTGVGLEALLPHGVPGVALTGLLAWPLVAARSLRDHVAAVASALADGDLQAARGRVAKLVGRDPTQLDAAGVARAALESLAENASDGVTAPLFWGAVFGLPGIAGYKAINTLDSMIGHRTPRHLYFGRAAARLDDVANFVPARLTGLALACVAVQPRLVLAVMRRDARRHRSPNAGWPEAALAGALGIRLSGPRVYADGLVNEPWLNTDAPDPDPVDMSAGLRLYVRAMAVIGLGLLAIGVLL